MGIFAHVSALGYLDLDKQQAAQRNKFCLGLGLATSDLVLHHTLTLFNSPTISSFNAAQRSNGIHLETTYQSQSHSSQRQRKNALKSENGKRIPVIGYKVSCFLVAHDGRDAAHIRARNIDAQRRIALTMS